MTRAAWLWLLVALLAAAAVAGFVLLGTAARAPADAWQSGPLVRYGGRVALIAVCLAAWFLTQRLIGARTPPASGTLGDGLHTLTAGANRWLHAHPRAANGLLIASSLGIDAMAVALLGAAILGPDLRPFLALFLVFLLRQICLLCCALPPPDGMIWRHPGVPSLMVTYGVANDFFFSGHTSIAVLAALEAAHHLPAWAAALVAALALFEAATVIVLRAHYTMDVIAGVLAAWCASALAMRLAG